MEEGRGWYTCSDDANDPLVHKPVAQSVANPTADPGVERSTYTQTRSVVGSKSDCRSRDP